MRSRFIFVLMLLVMSAPAPVLAAKTSGHPAPPQPGAQGKPFVPPTTPKRAVEALSRAYSNRSMRAFEGLLAADYRFHFSDGDSAGVGYVNGLSRDAGVRSAGGLFEGWGAGEDGAIEQADRIVVTVGEMEEGPDPEHPDSLSHYRVVIAHHMSFEMYFTASDTLMNLPADQIFFLVRGDVALRVPGQPGLSNRWYIRRWLENVRQLEATLSVADGQCEETTTAGMPTLALALGMRALDSPLCSTLKLACDLPGSEPATLEVFDVAGRRMAKRELLPTAAGSTLQVEAGSGMRFAPGAYFLRLTQGNRAPSRKMVLVAR
jgi:hypothetical protein